MIGATGDNGLGGVGVNWDVDIMQVDMGNGLSEANVIAAYNYPYEMRAIFNESDGARGALWWPPTPRGASIWPTQPTTLCGVRTTTTWENKAF